MNCVDLALSRSDNFHVQPQPDDVAPPAAKGSVTVTKRFGLRRAVPALLSVAVMLCVAAPAAAQQETTIALRGQAGFLFVSGGEGFLVGGGVGARPFNNRQVEIAGDLSFVRFEGTNGFYLAGNALYHFNTSDANFRPFAGGGLGILRGGGETEARLQIGGGLELRGS